MSKRKSVKANGFLSFPTWVQSVFEEKPEYIKNTKNEKNILKDGGRKGFKK